MSHQPAHGYHDVAQLLSQPRRPAQDSVGGRKFAFKTSEPERWRFSLRVTPDRFVELTDVPGVKPARYRGRFHRITIVNVAGFPDRYLEELVEWSYRRALGSSRQGRRHAVRGA